MKFNFYILSLEDQYSILINPTLKGLKLFIAALREIERFSKENSLYSESLNNLAPISLLPSLLEKNRMEMPSLLDSKRYFTSQNIGIAEMLSRDYIDLKLETHTLGKLEASVKQMIKILDQLHRKKKMTKIQFNRLMYYLTNQKRTNDKFAKLY
jgi:hypothetical protein